MKAPTEAKTPEAYIKSLDEPRRGEIKSLDELIQRAVPGLKRGMGIGIGYGPYHYKYASGREGDTHIISLASNKNYISVYILAVSDGKYLAELYKDKLGKVSVGKSCIRFKKIDDVNLGVIAELCQKAQAAMNSTDFSIEAA